MPSARAAWLLLPRAVRRASVKATRSAASAGSRSTRGLYKWGTGLKVSTDVTLNGGVNDVWIF